MRSWKDMSFDEFLNLLGIFLSMEVFEFHGPRRMYWSKEPQGIFHAMDFGRFMSRDRFECIIRLLQLSRDDCPDQQVLDFLDAVNKNLKDAVRPGTFLTLDESMIKSFHHDLKGKIKIIRKPRPIGNEIKNMSEAASNIVLHLELYEGKDVMQNKPYVKELGATTATTLRLTEHYHGNQEDV